MKTQRTRNQIKSCLWVVLFALLLVASAARAQTTNYYYESFEGTFAIDNWDVDNGTWEIGVPTFGPAANGLGSRAFGGTNCAATVLGGNYAEGVTSRLISTSFVVPGATNNPRLRFSHWFSFGGNDYGQVQIRVGAGSWQTVSGQYAGSGSGAWSQPSIDLSAYGGQTVRVGFLFSSIQGGPFPSVGAGWYVDDVAVVTGPIVFNSPEGFESGIGDWAADAGSWEVGNPTSGPGSARGGTNCAATVLGGNYAEGVASRLVSPSFTVPPAASNPRFRFWHWYSFGGNDAGQVVIRVGTNAWQSVSGQYVGSSSGVWSQPSIDLSTYGGQTVQIGFLFSSIQGGPFPSVGAGWYVDDVRLQHDFALLLDSANVRAQQNFCLPLRVFASDPATQIRFAVTIPGASLSNVSLDTGDRFATATLTQGVGSEWLIDLTTTPNKPVNGDEIIGSLCFRASAPKSAFAPLAVQNLEVTNLSGSQPRTVPFGGRAVVIANEALFEAFLGTNGQRTISLYGKPNTTYEIQRASNLNPPINWVPEWTNSVPAGMFRSILLNGLRANDPVLYLRANEK